jgi:hypothetical protein
MQLLKPTLPVAASPPLVNFWLVQGQQHIPLSRLVLTDMF